jgi:hypothetical protein
MFHNKINTSLFLETAKFMQSSGLLAAGYDLITLGGIVRRSVAITAVHTGSLTSPRVRY